MDTGDDIDLGLAFDVVFVSDNELAIAVDQRTVEGPGRVEVHDMRTGSATRVFSDSLSTPANIAFGPIDNILTVIGAQPFRVTRLRADTLEPIDDSINLELLPPEVAAQFEAGYVRFRGADTAASSLIFESTQGQTVFLIGVRVDDPAASYVRELFTDVGIAPQPRNAAISPDGNTVVHASGEGALRILTSSDGTPRYKPIEERIGFVSALRFVPATPFFLTGSSDGTIRLWDSKNGRQLGSSLIDLDGPISDIGVSNRGDRIAFAGWTSLYLIDGLLDASYACGLAESYVDISSYRNAVGDANAGPEFCEILGE